MRFIRIARALVAAAIVGFSFMFLAFFDDAPANVNRTEVQQQAIQEAINVVRTYLKYMEEERLLEGFAATMAPQTRDAYTEQYNLLIQRANNPVLLSKRLTIRQLDVVQTEFDQGYVVVRAVYDIEYRYVNQTVNYKRAENYIVGYFGPQEGWKIAAIEDYCSVAPNLCK